MFIFFALTTVFLIMRFSFPALLTAFALFFFSESSVGLQPNTTIFYLDEASFLITFITVFVIFSAFLYTPRAPSFNLALTAMFLACCGVFLSVNPVLLYFFYEASLFPILYIILKWGSYPERSLSSIILLTYTAVFTLPFLAVLSQDWSLSLTLESFSQVCSSNVVGSKSEALMTLVVFFCFCVKLPIYGLHFWLPIAHVEAPTFGSMILAGVLLKLGGIGLIRFSYLLNTEILSNYFLGYFMVGLAFSTLVCCVQSDLKRIIAYSSVSHIICIPPLICLDTSTSITAAVLIMLIHGLSSPLLFMIVGVVYSTFSSRQLVVSRGLAVTNPLLALVAILGFLFSLSAPPFPSFVGELFFLLCSISYSSLFMPFIFIFCLLSIVYNLNWLVSLTFSGAPTHPHTVTYSVFVPMLMSLAACGVLLLVLVSL